MCNLVLLVHRVTDFTPTAAILYLVPTYLKTYKSYVPNKIDDSLDVMLFVHREQIQTSRSSVIEWTYDVLDGIIRAPSGQLGLAGAWLSQYRLQSVGRSASVRLYQKLFTASRLNNDSRSQGRL